MHELATESPRPRETRLPRLRRMEERAQPHTRLSERADGGAAREFEDVWTTHARAVLDRCVFVMRGRREEADEAFSRAAFVAFQKYAAHRGAIRNPRQWLLRLAHNVCMDLYREHARRSRLEDADPAEWDGAAVAADHRPADPERLLLEQEERTVLHAAICALPRRLREPLELRLGPELPDRRIARVLGISEDAVRKRLQDARTALRPILRAYRDGAARLPLTKQAAAASVQREPQTLARAASDAPPNAPRTHARASANPERR